MDKMMKSMSKCVEDMVLQLSTKYGFDKAEAMEFIMPAGEAVRGRPSKPKKKVVNKTEMVEDVIMSIMENELQPVISNPALETVPAQAEAVIVAAVADTPLKKKAAPKKKKAEALVAPDTVAALIAVESTDEAQAEPIIVAAVEAPKEKKKAAPRKKKAEALVTEAVVVETAVVEAVAVVAQAEPVTVAAVVEAPKEKKKAAPKKKKAEAEAATEVAVVAQAAPVTVAAVVEAPKEKKKAAPKKKKAEAEAATEVAVVAQAAPVTVASEGGLKGDTPLKKKAAPKKKAEAPVAARKVAAGKPEPEPVPVVVVEAPKPVVAQGGLAGVSPAEEVSADEEPAEETVPSAVGECEGDAPSDDESTSVTEWTCKKDGKTYLKSCEDNCGEDTCDCAGEVYDPESQEVIGHWNGVTIETAEDDE
jgi:hypothetical protein